MRQVGRDGTHPVVALRVQDFCSASSSGREARAVARNEPMAVVRTKRTGNA